MNYFFRRSAAIAGSGFRGLGERKEVSQAEWVSQTDESWKAANPGKDPISPTPGLSNEEMTQIFQTDPVWNAPSKGSVVASKQPKILGIPKEVFIGGSILLGAVVLVGVIKVLR